MCYISDIPQPHEQKYELLSNNYYLMDLNVSIRMYLASKIPNSLLILRISTVRHDLNVILNKSI